MGKREGSGGFLFRLLKLPYRIPASGVGSLTTTNNGTIYVGDAAKSGGFSGYLTVSDADPNGTSGGNLYVYNGSTLNHGGHAIVGDNANEYGWATVADPNSSWTNSGSLFVGWSGQGTLTIASGGSVSNIDAFLGLNTGGTGTTTVDGSGSSWESTEDLSLGDSSASDVGSLTTTNSSAIYVGDVAKSGGREQPLMSAF